MWPKRDDNKLFSGVQGSGEDCRELWSSGDENSGLTPEKGEVLSSMKRKTRQYEEKTRTYNGKEGDGRLGSMLREINRVGLGEPWRKKGRREEGVRRSWVALGS